LLTRLETFSYMRTRCHFLKHEAKILMKISFRIGLKFSYMFHRIPFTMSFCITLVNVLINSMSIKHYWSFMEHFRKCNLIVDLATRSRQWKKINYRNFNTKHFKTIAKLFATYLLSGECLNGCKQKDK
jgi:hypothetical protein